MHGQMRMHGLVAGPWSTRLAARMRVQRARGGRSGSTDRSTDEAPTRALANACSCRCPQVTSAVRGMEWSGVQYGLLSGGGVDSPIQPVNVKVRALRLHTNRQSHHATLPPTATQVLRATHSLAPSLPGSVEACTRCMHRTGLEYNAPLPKLVPTVHKVHMQCLCMWHLHTTHHIASAKLDALSYRVAADSKLRGSAMRATHTHTRRGAHGTGAASAQRISASRQAGCMRRSASSERASTAQHSR